jgi:hypothetical protein
VRHQKEQEWSWNRLKTPVPRAPKVATCVLLRAVLMVWVKSLRLRPLPWAWTGMFGQSKMHWPVHEFNDLSHSSIMVSTSLPRSHGLMRSIIVGVSLGNQFNLFGGSLDWSRKAARYMLFSKWLKNKGYSPAAVRARIELALVICVRAWTVVIENKGRRRIFVATHET